MKSKLLLVFTMCAMMSIAQTKSVSNTADNQGLIEAADNNFAVATLNETPNYDDHVKIYPTITEDLIYFGIKEENNFEDEFTITVYDIYGKKQNAEIHKGTININDLKPGIYIIQFTCKKFSVTKNVVKK